MRSSLPQFNTEERSLNHIGEVIETSSTEFLAQCLEPEDLNFPSMPPFGSWVKSIDETSGNIVFGVITFATTNPIDSIHRARALGLSLDELKEQQPQIFAMLKTEFRSTLVGFTLPPTDLEKREGKTLGRVFQYLPPRPPQIHQAVYQCTAEDVIHFTEKLEFLRTLLQVAYPPAESLIAACIREVFQCRQADRPWLVNVGRTLSVLLKDDYDRLRYILSQIHW